MKKMKNVYVKPEMEVMDIIVESMLASSLSEGEPDQPSDANTHRGSWGNLWD